MVTEPRARPPPPRGITWHELPPFPTLGRLAAGLLPGTQPSHGTQPPQGARTRPHGGNAALQAVTPQAAPGLV